MLIKETTGFETDLKKGDHILAMKVGGELHKFASVERRGDTSESDKYEYKFLGEAKVLIKEFKEASEMFDKKKQTLIIIRVRRTGDDTGSRTTVRPYTVDVTMDWVAFRDLISTNRVLKGIPAIRFKTDALKEIDGICGSLRPRHSMYGKVKEGDRIISVSQNGGIGPNACVTIQIQPEFSSFDRKYETHDACATQTSKKKVHVDVLIENNFDIIYVRSLEASNFDGAKLIDDAQEQYPIIAGYYPRTANELLTNPKFQRGAIIEKLSQFHAK